MIPTCEAESGGKCISFPNACWIFWKPESATKYNRYNGAAIPKNVI